MRINDGSICSECSYFEHECDIPFGEDDYGCIEICKSPNKDIVEEFYDADDKIIDCKTFKE